MHHLLEIRATRQFFETPPIFRTLSLFDSGLDGSQAQLAGTDDLGASFSVLFVHINYARFTMLLILPGRAQLRENRLPMTS